MLGASVYDMFFYCDLFAENVMLLKSAKAQFGVCVDNSVLKSLFLHTFQFFRKFFHLRDNDGDQMAAAAAAYFQEKFRGLIDWSN